MVTPNPTRGRSRGSDQKRLSDFFRNPDGSGFIRSALLRKAVKAVYWQQTTDLAGSHKGLERAGIEDFRWHDLRHTWASWHVQNGTPLYVLPELWGWESPEMVRKYAHLSCEHLAPYAERLSGSCQKFCV